MQVLVTSNNVCHVLLHLLGDRAAHPIEPPSTALAALRILAIGTGHRCGARLAITADDGPLGRAQLPDPG